MFSICGSLANLCKRFESKKDALRVDVIMAEIELCTKTIVSLDFVLFVF